MKKTLSYLVILSFSLCINNAYAKDSTTDKNTEPELQDSWIEDENGNVITEGVSPGDIVELVITANKASDGELMTLDLEEASCNYQLIHDTLKSNNGVIDGIIVNGDSYDTDDHSRELNNQTRLRFKIIRETEACLSEVAKAQKKRLKSNVCKKRSWPFRRYLTKQTRPCHKKR